MKPHNEHKRTSVSPPPFFFCFFLGFTHSLIHLLIHSFFIITSGAFSRTVSVLNVNAE